MFNDFDGEPTNNPTKDPPTPFFHPSRFHLYGNHYYAFHHHPATYSQATRPNTNYLD
ncbi:hypothetical protein H4Q26_004069 [Puccinia striiformis f. sp. tritici PST-130]|nr:hypothetical protein H4Q26_004069 [Puccinia striiformis f. sp. tritici PST-130]